MTKKCPITQQGPLSGNNVSHSNRKSRRRYLPNMQMASLNSELLGTAVKMRLSVKGLRTIEHNDGLDGYLMTTSNRKLSPECLRLKKRLLAARKAAAAA